MSTGFVTASTGPIDAPTTPPLPICHYIAHRLTCARRLACVHHPTCTCPSPNHLAPSPIANSVDAIVSHLDHIPLANYVATHQNTCTCMIGAQAHPNQLRSRHESCNITLRLHSHHQHHGCLPVHT